MAIYTDVYRDIKIRQACTLSAFYVMLIPVKQNKQYLKFLCTT